MKDVNGYLLYLLKYPTRPKSNSEVLCNFLLSLQATRLNVFRNGLPINFGISSINVLVP